MAPTAAPASDRYERIAINLIDPSPLNPRKSFDAARLSDLQRSIEGRKEVLVPLLLRAAKKPGRYEIIDGERRWRACQQIVQVTNADNRTAFQHVPAVIRELSDGEVLEIQLISAIQRQDLTPLEEARGYTALIESNKAKYSAAYIADRIGRTERYVVDRMRLVQLIPILRQLLEAERILVGHAELLCRLKPEDQGRAVEWDDDRPGRNDAGLWQSENDRLRLDDEDEQEPSKKNLYRGLKPVTVKELESWIAHHVRFDVQHMAAAAPLDFGAVLQKVEDAQAQPGRGKKVIAITDEYRVEDDVKDPNERTYGSQSWKRADGQENSKACDHSVLGTFVAGRGYGTTLQVCINRDKCTVHFGQEIKAREKRQREGAKAPKEKRVTQEDWRERQRLDDEKRERDEAAYEKFVALVLPAVEAKLPKTLDRRVFEFLYNGNGAKVPPSRFIAVLVLGVFSEWTRWHGQKPNLVKGAKHFGIDVAAIEKQLAAETTAGAKKPEPKKKAAKKAKGKS